MNFTPRSLTLTLVACVGCGVEGAFDLIALGPEGSPQTSSCGSATEAPVTGVEVGVTDNDRFVALRDGDAVPLVMGAQGASESQPGSPSVTVFRRNRRRG
jgi:hypothetical protein